MDTPEGQKYSREGSGAELLAAPTRGQLRRATAAGEFINAEYKKAREYVMSAPPISLSKKKLEIQTLEHLYDEAAALSEDFFGEGVHGLSEEHEDRITELERLSREIADVAAAICAQESESTPTETVEPDGDPQLNELFVAAGFKDDFSTPLAPTQDAQEAAVPYVEAADERAVDFYRRWQAGDPSLFLTMWGKELGAIKRDIFITLRAAGYDEVAIATIDAEVVKPWLDRVGEKKRGRNRDVKWGDLRDEILHSMRDLLAGREPHVAILVGQEAVPAPDLHGETEVAETETVPDQAELAPHIDTELEQAQFAFLAMRDKIAGVPELAVWRELGDRILSALSTISERDEAVALRLKHKYLKTLTDLNVRLERELSERPDSAVVVAGAMVDPDTGVPANLPVENATHTFPDSGAGDSRSELPKPVEVPVPSTEPPVLTKAVERGYQEANRERAVAREAFVSARDEYYTALREFYKVRLDAGGDAVKDARREVRRLTYKAREFFGGSTELPPYLNELKEKHDLLQMEYALKLNGALMARAESREGNREYNSLADAKTRAAFANRFVVQTALETRGVRHGSEEPSRYVTMIKGALAHMKNHKWLVRAGFLTAYAAIGAATGGVSAAVMVGSRFVAGTVAGAAGGAAGGALGMRAFKSGVERARTALDETLASETDSLSFSSLAAAQEKYGKAYKTMRRKEAVQGAAGIAGAVLGGMAAGRFAAEAVSDVWNAVATDPIIEMKAVAVPRYAPNGEPLPALSVEGVTLRGAHVTDLATADLEVTDVVIPKVMNEIRLHIKDLLEAHPNMNQGKLEEEVFSRLETKYGGQEWWQKADIKNLDIGTIKLEDAPEASLVLDQGPVVTEPLTPEVDTPAPTAPVPVTESPVELPPADAPATAPVEAAEAAVSAEHTVAGGDTLMKIMKEEYADVLKELTPAEQDRALMELFDRARTDATLRDSIGLRSGDIDRIYVGEELSLEKLGAELKSLVVTESSVQPRTGALTVAMEGGVEDVPIRVNSPIDASYIDKGAINGYMERTEFDTTEAVHQGADTFARSGPGIYPPRPEVGFVASGNYFDSPQYQSFLRENNLPPELVKDATRKFALEFEGRTYSWLNELLQKFDSPYEELRGITVAELDAVRREAGTSEEALRIILAKQAAAEAAERGVAVSEVPKTFNVSTVRAWDSLIDAIRRTDGFVYNENTTLEDLVKRYVGEQMIQNNYNARLGVRSR